MKELDIAIINIGIVWAWVYVAVHFGHWWITLFCLITMFSSSKK